MAWFVHWGSAISRFSWISNTLNGFFIKLNFLLNWKSSNTIHDPVAELYIQIKNICIILTVYVYTYASLERLECSKILSFRIICSIFRPASTCTLYIVPMWYTYNHISYTYRYSLNHLSCCWRSLVLSVCVFCVVSVDSRHSWNNTLCSKRIGISYMRDVFE